MVLGGLLGLAVPFHRAPGVEEFHTKPEFHVNGSGMGPDFARKAPIFARIIFGRTSTTKGKVVTARLKCFTLRGAFRAD
jgi:hypothetical protein